MHKLYKWTLSSKSGFTGQTKVDTVTIKYAYHCDCQAVPDNHSDSNCRLLKKLSASMRHLPKKTSRHLMCYI